MHGSPTPRPLHAVCGVLRGAPSRIPPSQAVWALNGDRWDEASRAWQDEWYGVLAQDYATVRNPHMHADLMGLIAKAA